MTEDFVTRIRNVFADTPQIMTWINEDTYAAAEARAHIGGMWEALKEAASRIEHLERELAEERHSREVAASKGWEFSDRIKDTEKECTDVLIAGADRIKKLEAALRVAAGYISTKEGHTDQHPQDVYDWIIQATVEKKND